jgi:hypothetical protein
LFPNAHQEERNAMNKFTRKFTNHIQGVLCGFDRLVFRGYLRRISYPEGMMGYLSRQSVLLKDFGRHVEKTSQQIKQAALNVAEQLKRPVIYLQSSQVSKEKIAQQMVVKDQVQQGLVCMLTCVEPCRTFEVHRNAQTHRLELRSALRKCLHLYQYWQHPRLGFMNVRLQTWFPFSVQICLNGREWLARTLDRKQMPYAKQDNCFTWIQDYQRAQKWMNQQLRVNWPRLLNDIAGQINPAHTQVFAQFAAQYYWTTYQSEWALDWTVDPQQLRRLYPKLLHLGITCFSSADILRFLGKHPNQDGQVRANFTQPITSDVRRRTEGVRIKHFVGKNSIKLYDKAYTPNSAVLRAEVTLNDPAQFLVYRPKEGANQQDRQWRIMRRGIADLHRRAQVCQKALDRYADALASVDDNTTLEELTQGLECRVAWKGRSVRALHPFDPQDRQLLETVNRAEFTLHGFRNRDLQALFYSTPAASPQEQRRRSAAIGRKLVLLRAHGLIQKLPNTHRYQVTAIGRQIINALLTARSATLNQLMALQAA